jgi:hypothetical protein
MKDPNYGRKKIMDADAKSSINNADCYSKFYNAIFAQSCVNI